MANKLWKIEDSQTGKVYEIEGPADASEDEVYSFLEQQLASTGAPTPAKQTTQGPVAAPSAPAGPSGVQPPAQRQQIETAVVQGNADQSDPRFLLPEEEAQVTAAWGDPNVSDEDYHALAAKLSQGHGRLYTGRGPLEGRKGYQEYVAKGGQPLGPEYSDFVQSLPAAGPTATADTQIGRGYQDAVQYGTPGFLARLYHDWAGTGMDALKQRFPQATPDQLEALQEAIINRTQKDVRAANQEATQDDNTVLWLMGQIPGSAGVEDFVPGGQFAGQGVRGVAKRGGVVAGTNTGADVGYQVGDIAADVQDEYNVEQTLLAPAIGAAFHGAVEGTGALARTISRSARSTPAVEAPTSTAPISVPTARKNSKAYKAEITDTATGIADHVNTVVEGWKNSPEFEVYQNFRKLDGIENDAIGVTTPDGKVLINAENVLAEAKAAKVGPEDIVSAITYHEALGHYGLAQKFGDDLDALLSNFVDNSTTTFKAKVDQWLEAHPDEYKGVPNRELRAAEELLAEWSEQGRMPVTLVNRLTNMLKDFARQMGLDLKFSEREIRTILGMAHNAVISGKGRDVRGNGFRYTYAGRKAQGQPESSAQEDRWFKGPDGQWRWEIDDSKADLAFLEDRPAVRDRIGDNAGVQGWMVQGKLFDNLADPEWKEQYRTYGGSLENIINHPELFKAYPELKNIKVIREPVLMDLGRQTQGTFDRQTNTINIPPYATYDPMDVLLHEVQHVIQGIEGFAKGGNKQTSVSKMSDEHLLKVSSRYAQWLEKELLDAEIRTQAIQNFADNPLSWEWRSATRERDIAYKRWQENVSRQATTTDLSKEIWREATRREEQLANQIAETYGFTRKQIADSPKLLREWVELRSLFLDNDEIVIRAKIADAVEELETARFVTDEFRKSVEAGEVDLLRKYLKDDKLVGFQAYEHLFGEVEARDVEKRRKLDAEQRKALVPYSSEAHIAEDDFIFDFSGTDTTTNADILKFPDVTSAGFKRPKKTSRTQREDTLIRRKLKAQQDAEPNQWTEWADAQGLKYAKKVSQLSEEDEVRNAKAILEMALEGYVPERRSWAEGKRAARERGLTAKQIRSAKSIGELDKRLFQYDAVADKTDQQLTELHAKMTDGTFTMRDKAKYLETVFSYTELMARIFEDQAEIGRALNAMKALSFTKNRIANLNEILAEYEGNNIRGFADEEVFNRFAKEIQGLMAAGNSAGVHNMLKQVLKPYWWQYILSFRHAMMLSGIGTHAKNAADNAMMIARELEEQALALPGGLLRQGLRAVGLNVKEGVSAQEVAARMYGLLRAAVDSGTYQDTFSAFKEGHANTPYSSKIEMQDAHIPGVSKIQDALHASDTFFRAFHMNANLYTIGVRKARADGFKGMAALEEGSNLATSPTKEMIDEAKKYTDIALLVDTPSTPSAKLEAMKAIRPNMKWGEQVTAFGANVIFPFFRVTDRLLFQKLRRSPLFFLDRRTREDLAEGGAKMDIAIARMVYGSALIYYYWQQAGEGNVTGAAPADYEKEQALQAGGYLPNAVKEDGKFVDASALNLSFLPQDVQNSVATNIATIRKAYEDGKADADSTAQGLGYAALALLTTLSSNSFAENITTYTEPFRDAEELNRDTAIANVGGSLASQFIPAAMRQYNQMYHDPVKRDTVGDKSIPDRIYGRIASAVPGLSDDLPAKHDVYGDVMEQGRSLSSISNYQNIKDDAVSVELQRLEKTTKDPVVRGAPSSFEYEGERIKLTAEGKQEWQRVQGYYLRLGMADTIKSDEWKQATDAEKIAIVKEIRTEAYDLTKEYMLPLLGVTTTEEEPEE